MAGRMFDFDGGGGHRLSGRIDTPETTPRGWAIFAHCFTCGKDSLAAARVARALARAGIGVLRFDFAGIGTSGGLLADGETLTTWLVIMSRAIIANLLHSEGAAPSPLTAPVVGIVPYKLLAAGMNCATFTYSKEGHDDHIPT